MATFKDETQLTDIPTLRKELSQPPSRDIDPKLIKAEEEILQHYKEFAHFANHVCKDDPDAGKRFYDLPEAYYFDLMGAVQRPGFTKHYDQITPYLADAQIAFKDLEIMAVTPTFGYATAYQRYWGVATDGNTFDLTFRTTSLVRKRGDQWKYVHEHFSFPANMATQKADLTSGLSIADNISLETNGK